MTNGARRIEEQLRAWGDALEFRANLPAVEPRTRLSGRARRYRLAPTAASVLLLVGLSGLLLVLREGKPHVAVRPVPSLPESPASSITVSTTISSSVTLMNTSEPPDRYDQLEACSPIEQFLRLANVSLSPEAAQTAEKLAASRQEIDGVRAVLFAADGTPSVIVDPNATVPHLELGYETLVSCVSDADLASVTDAMGKIPLTEDQFISVSYQPFVDAIQVVVTNIDEVTIRNAIPQHLTERQVTIAEGQVSRG
jgi:hypothetical protein